MKSKIFQNYKDYLGKASILAIFLAFGWLLHSNRLFVKGIYAPGKIYVKVSGNIKQPGVYELHSGSTIQQLIDKAGGLQQTNRSTRYNPESILHNGQVVFLSVRK
ncbi:MAG: SLBB domain-containing protein [Spirochaetota bacterium]